MPKYVYFFSFTPETWARMISSPSDRVAAVRKAAEAMGGSLETYYFMFGEHDGLVICELPDSATAAAMALAVTSTGRLKHLETHELIAPDDIGGILEKARSAGSQYTPPG